MEFFPKTPSIDWIGKRYAFFALSGTIACVSIASFATRGLNYGIDFTGGTLVQVAYASPRSLSDLRGDVLKTPFPDALLQSVSGTHSFLVRVKGVEKLDAQGLDAFTAALQAASPSNRLTIERQEFVGPSVGRHLKRQAATAILLALAAIIIYVAFRFSNPIWGAAGVVALIHDVLGTVGLFSLLQREVDLVIVAAFLTIAGYSINDTIVIFDRMRERTRLYRREPLGELINGSINETLSRTLITNGCVVAVVLAIFFFGGSVIHDFALAMLFGGVIGTYSTIAVATPLVFEWDRLSRGGRAPAAAPAKPEKARQKV